MSDLNDSTLHPGLAPSATQGGVGPQSGETAVHHAPDFRGTRTPEQVQADPHWPEWAPALPTDLPTPAWRAEGREPNNAELAAALDERAHSPSEYRLPAGFLGEPNEQSLSHGQALQSLLWHAGMPAPAGKALLESVMAAATRSPGEMDDVTFQLKAGECEAMLKRQLGEQEYTRCRSALGKLFDELNGKSGGKLSDFLDDHAEVLVDPMVQLELLMHAGRRKGGTNRGR
ncbi:hypothetical protein GCM10011521_04150 [Arenimonas soli]|uniref:Uncharacterized protein n=1 Tax=Arenimonas soli TaxID=2269504 RepID=A0ABQ1HB59_9GAMM|nr:hypothetical protein [Arenimonas soli]GGA69103.1 hypothetical protein GCM10011521_04150 [Arenimonas soli]